MLGLEWGAVSTRYLVYLQTPPRAFRHLKGFGRDSAVRGVRALRFALFSWRVLLVSGFAETRFYQSETVMD